MENNSIAIVGWHEGSAGQTQAWLEKTSDYRIKCFINPSDEPITINPDKIRRDASQFSYPTATNFKGRPLINSVDWIRSLKKMSVNKVLVTTDDPHKRYAQIKQAKAGGLQLINAIHPTALIMEDAILSDNIILHAKSYVGYRAELSPGVIINVGSQIDHHNVIRDCATIDPGCVLAGNVTVGSFAKIHTGVTIINRIRIGENSIIGAGSVIIKDIPDNVTVAGVPGKIIKHHNSREP